MPFESLSCPRCGSGSLQEVKPETYFCNHCDNVFKHVSPSRAGSTGGCELPEEGRPCGVPAIGHCRTCHRAFCLTHQARAARGLENLLDSESGSAAAAFRGYIDWCAACRTAEFDKLDDKDKPALGLPFGRFLEEQFFAGESRAGTSADTPQGKAVSNLVVEADRVLEQYQHETPYKYYYNSDETFPILARESFQLLESHIVDRSTVEHEKWERITRIRRQGGSRFYIYNSQGGSPRTAVFDISIWVPGGSKMLVAKSTYFYQGGSKSYTGRPPYTVRYTRVEEVGISRMDGIAGSLKKYFPARPLPGEKAPAKKAARRRWFY
jgi:hypothetical protein